MPPFGSSDFNDGFFESLPPLELSKTPMAASTLFLEPLESLEAPEKFVLAFVDESGEPIRAATEADLVNLLEGDASKAPEAKQEEQSAALTEAEFKSLLRQPVCRHCGVTESPQWRRGPPAKPILCNACGTRYRRTGQLNHAAQNAKKRTTHSDCAREMVGEKGRAMKQPRVVA